MVASIPDYNKYAYAVLAKQMDPKVFNEIMDIEKKKALENPRYEELLMPNFYAQHICRLDPWPEPVVRCFTHLYTTKVSKEIYVIIQRHSEFGASGRLANWVITTRIRQ